MGYTPQSQQQQQQPQLQYTTYPQYVAHQSAMAPSQSQVQPQAQSQVQAQAQLQPQPTVQMPLQRLTTKLPKKQNSLTGSSSKKLSAGNAPRKVSAFVTKLFAMLQDPNLSHLIWWSRLYQNDSATFALLPGSQFANSLTTYFKHGNVASFVRQLHMYGFHKVCDSSPPPLPANVAKVDSSDNSQPVWEFRHSSGKFRKGDHASLYLIKRRSTSVRAGTTAALVADAVCATIRHWPAPL
ncbi:unnamed protein product [Ambrosiozyma monospora]|uniref:Unnamed protein product n=1 Tax=Ambrosiozyma monospora TaxID=43982 RepID=A0ACB5TM23_AMBMO|nr:unnamed protein product [Ambrosiozyma monospora]